MIKMDGCGDVDGSSSSDQVGRIFGDKCFSELLVVESVALFVFWDLVFLAV